MNAISRLLLALRRWLRPTKHLAIPVSHKPTAAAMRGSISDFRRIMSHERR